MSRLLRVDLHSHTRHSPDAYTSPAELVERAAEVGLDRVAVTDHGEIEGALEARSLDPTRIIVGEEIRCRCGTEFIGLFLRERVPPGLEAREVAERVDDQGGVLYAPHPYAYARHALSRAATALELADVVEVFNARAFLPRWNRRAGRTARDLGLPQCAGSDAHFPRELGRAYSVMPEFASAEGFRRAATASQPVLERVTGPWMHLASAGLKIARVCGERVPHPSPRHALEVAEKV
jgi:predicted metal-dependent phosphoesterase TrpH